MLLVLGCLVVVGAAVASVLGRDSLPFAQGNPNAVASGGVKGPTANRDNKKDKLAAAVAIRGTASASAPFETDPPAALLSAPLRQAFASDSPVATRGLDVAAPIAIPPSAQPQKPKLAAKPPVQKSYALLSDAQIAALKGRLKLTPSQESYWPDIETALRAVARKIHQQKQANPAATSPPIDPDSDEVSQLKSAAMPLLFQLREDQKREVRALARIIGLEAVASRI